MLLLVPQAIRSPGDRVQPRFFDLLTTIKARTVRAFFDSLEGVAHSRERVRFHTAYLARHRLPSRRGHVVYGIFHLCRSALNRIGVQTRNLALKFLLLCKQPLLIRFDVHPYLMCLTLPPVIVQRKNAR